MRGVGCGGEWFLISSAVPLHLGHSLLYCTKSSLQKTLEGMAQRLPSHHTVDLTNSKAQSTLVGLTRLMNSTSSDFREPAF